ncbi:hypothetical protein BACI349Y_240035 [Bacillus sp. 349Y]|nr:hypothetical protein BACI349Y_240035 [Bacillus sp. 349Y]
MLSKWLNALVTQLLSLTVLVKQKTAQSLTSRLLLTLVKSKLVLLHVLTVWRNTTNFFASKINWLTLLNTLEQKHSTTLTANSRFAEIPVLGRGFF